MPHIYGGGWNTNKFRKLEKQKTPFTIRATPMFVEKPA